VSRAPPHNPYGRWALCFFSDTAARAIAPSSSIPFADYVEQRVRDNTVDSLRTAARLAPTHGIIFARLAMQLPSQTNRTPGVTQEIEWCARHAVELSRGEAETWLTRAKLLER